MTEKGRRLGRYRLEELLGQGGMAEVWRAIDERLGRTVAVKVILATHARDGHFRERFHKEAQLVASLDHPNILPVYDYGDEDGVPYLVMPYLEGGTLRDRMVGSPIPFPQAVSWVRQLGDALDAAHAAGILHRDVKPANVLVRKDDRLALADFGIAKILETVTGLTATGMVVGTPIYMAPEQAQGKPATPASDRYALGILAYELLSGRPPFDGESALALMHQHVTTPAPRLSSVVYGLPSGLDPVFETALAKEPDRRPPTCRAFADLLLTFVPTGAGPDPDGVTTPWASVDRTSPTVIEAVPRWTAGRRLAQDPDLTSQPTISTAPRASRRTVFAAVAAGLGVTVLAGAWLLAPRLRPAAGPAVPAAEAAPAQVAAPAPAQGEPAGRRAKVVNAPGPAASAPGDGPGISGQPGSPLATEPAGQAPEAAVPPPVPVPPGAAEPAAVPPAGDPGSEAAIGATHTRLDLVLGGTKRPTREDFELAAREAHAVLEGEPGKAGARALELYALGGLAYVERRDDEALRQLMAAQAVAGKMGAWEVRLVRALGFRGRGGSGLEGWELALAFGDARREAGRLLAKELERNPGDPRPLLGRAALHRLDGRSDEAIADATKVFEARPPGPLGPAAAELIADGHAARARWEESARWYREAAIPENPVSARAGWEGARILESRLGRKDEARELYAAACGAGNRKACAETGQPAPRPRLFPRRRGP